MTIGPRIRLPSGFAGLVSIPVEQTSDAQRRDLQALRDIVNGLDNLEDRLDRSEIPRAVTMRGYFTPDEDDRVRQGVLSYRNHRLAAYEIIFRNRNYATMERGPGEYGCFLLAFGAALVLYAKSLRIIEFAEHVPLLRAKINEPDVKFDLEEGFFDDVVACYSQPRNFKALSQANTFWWRHRRAIQKFVREAGLDWVWSAGLIRRQRRLVRHRLFHVLWQRLRHDWRAFVQTLLSPFRQARRGFETFLGGRFADARVTSGPACAITPEMVAVLRENLRPGDVLLMRNDSRLTAALLPGFWTHAALFLGSKTDLEHLGLPAHPHGARHWQEIPESPAASALVLEALFPCVQVNPLEKCLQVDHLAVFRPGLPASDVAAAIGEGLGHLGKPYDLDFDFNNTSRVVCTELIYRSYHSRGNIRFTLTKRLGRYTLSGDDIVAHVLDTSLPSIGPAPTWTPVALILKRRDSLAHEAPAARIAPLLRRIRRGWRPTRRIVQAGAAGPLTAELSPSARVPGAAGNDR
ncbi:MAG: YiiX/YebB-like N1pC/P60 family cysteine hydrolase [Verrucomicrobiia bacterium]